MGINSSELGKLLSQELESLRLRESSLEAHLKGIVAELDEVRRRQDLVRALLGVPDAEARTVAASASAEGGELKQATSRPSQGIRKNVADIAYDILVARGKKPMYYEDLAEQVVASGGVLGGDTPGQTLVARISRDPRFVRPEKRGWYAAREFYPRAKSVGSRNAESKRSGKSVRTQGKG